MILALDYNDPQFHGLPALMISGGLILIGLILMLFKTISDLRKKDFSKDQKFSYLVELSFFVPMLILILLSCMEYLFNWEGFSTGLIDEIYLFSPLIPGGGILYYYLDRGTKKRYSFMDWVYLTTSIVLIIIGFMMFYSTLEVSSPHDFLTFTCGEQS